jgi:micrococcal nuclease
MKRVIFSILAVLLVTSCSTPFQSQSAPEMNLIPGSAITEPTDSPSVYPQYPSLTISVAPPQNLPSNYPAPTPSSKPKATLPSTISTSIDGQVTRVIDGDTIEVNIGGSIYTVRYIGMDTPETVDPNRPVGYYGLEASKKNKELVSNRIVRLEKDVSETDKYGRLLRYVYVGDLFINAELVRFGYAQVATYPPDVKYQDYFLQLQQQARQSNLGLWAPHQSPGPATAIHASTSQVYVGSINSNKYHYPACEYAKQISTTNQVWFSSPADAKARGYVACKVCNPALVGR